MSKRLLWKPPCQRLTPFLQNVVFEFLIFLSVFHSLWSYVILMFHSSGLNFVEKKLYTFTHLEMDRRTDTLDAHLCFRQWMLYNAYSKSGSTILCLPSFTMCFYAAYVLLLIGQDLEWVALMDNVDWTHTLCRLLPYTGVSRSMMRLL